MNKIKETGVGRLTLLVFVIIFGCIAFAAYEIVPFYYYYFDLENQARQVITLASTESDLEIRDKLMYYIKKYDIPCDPEDLKISRSGDKIQIRLKYSEVFYVSWGGKDYDLKTFDFVVFAEGKF